MNWFRELLAKFTQLLSGKPKKSRTQRSQKRKPYEKALQQATQGEQTATQFSKMPGKADSQNVEQPVTDESVTLACEFEEKHSSEHTHTSDIEEGELIQRHESSIALEAASPIEALQPEVKPNGEDSVKQLESASELLGELPITPRKESQLPASDFSVTHLQPSENPENEEISPEVVPSENEAEQGEQPSGEINRGITESVGNSDKTQNEIQLPERQDEVSECVLQPMSASAVDDTNSTDLQEQRTAEKDERIAKTEKSDTVQRITIDGLELVAHGDVQWEKEQENEFTLRLGETENELAEVSLKEIVRLRLIRKESLVLPPSDDESAWAKNAIQATDLILLPFKNQEGSSKTFVSDGVVITIWETAAELENTTWFAAAVLTYQMSYILVGRKAKLISTKELSECFAADKKAEI